MARPVRGAPAALSSQREITLLVLSSRLETSTTRKLAQIRSAQPISQLTEGGDASFRRANPARLRLPARACIRPVTRRPARDIWFAIFRAAAFVRASRVRVRTDPPAIRLEQRSGT